MFDQITNHLKRNVDFSDDEIVFFLSMLEFKSYGKYDVIFKPGETCRHLSYVNKGLVRCYYDSPEKTYTLTLASEDFWFTDYESFMLAKPTEIYAEALEETEVYQLSGSAWQTIFNSGFNFEKFGRIMAEMRFLDFIRREKAIRMQPPAQRYTMLQKDYPEVAKRAPLKYVASLLGFEPETLSRIRNKIKNPKR